jgi:hypothetical protein
MEEDLAVEGSAADKFTVVLTMAEQKELERLRAQDQREIKAL